MTQKFEIEPGIIVSKLDVKDGDTLIITIDTDIWNVDTVEYMVDSLQKFFPNNNIIGILKGCDITIKKSIESEK